MPSRRSGKRSSRKEKRAKPEVVEDVVEEQSDEEIASAPTTSKRKSHHRKKPSKIPVSSSRKRRKRHASDSSDEGEQLSDYGHESSDNSSTSDEEEVEFEEAAEEDEFEETESVGEENLRKRTYIPRDRDPVYIQNRSFEPLTLPPSSEDVVISSDIALQAFGVYEILRRFGQSLQLTPFRLEDFCCAMLAEENSLLLCEIFSSVMRLMVRESEHIGSWLAPHDEKDSVYLAVSSLDNLTWPELVRSFLQSSSDYASGLKIVEQSHFPCVSAKEKLDLLELLCSALLRLPIVIRAALNAESVIQHEESCRSCQKRGDLICCESCPATFHLECTSPPLKEIPEGEWFCSVCKFNQIPGVFDCITEVEKQNYSLRHEPLGLDRHGRRFAFIARRLLVYAEDESSVSYYSTVQQFEEVVALLDPVDLEKELCETLTELDAEIRRHMEVTAKLTKKGASGRPTYLDKADAVVVKRLEDEEERLRKEEENKEMEVDEVKDEPKTDESLTNGPSSPENKEEEVAGPRVATRTRTGAIIAKSYADTPLNHKLKEPGITPPPYTSDPSRTFDLSKVVGPLYKLGAEGAFRQYRNIYHESQHAQTKVLKQEERERKRHLAGKFCLPGEKPATTDFRWSGSTLGLCKSVVPTLRSTLLDIEKNVHPAYYHPFWASYRAEWVKSVEKAEKPEELALALSRFESSCKPVIFFPAWHESLGCLKWGRYAAVDREEARSRRRDDEEITSRSAKKAYVNFVQGVQHQIWKHKGEEFRLSGRGGVFWWSSRFVEQPETPCSPNTAVPDYNVEDDVLDISAAFRSDNARFYPMDDVLNDQLKKTLKTTDRLMAIEPYVSSPPVVEETKKLDVAKTDVTENVQPKHELKDGLVNGQATEAEKQAMEKMAGGIAVSDVEMTELPKPTEKPESADGKGPKEPVAPTTAGIVNLNNPKNVTYKAVLPALLRMTKEEDLMDFFRVSRTDFMVLALSAGLMELPGFKYDYKSAQYWEYPHFPRPNIRTIWRFRTYAVRNWGGVALQMKVLHAGMRWEDLQTKPPPGGKRVRQDESGVCTSEVVKKRSTARFSDFPRFEYLIRREVVPCREGNQKNLLKSTPGREGLRERKLESPKHREPFTHESWVGEEEVELWEVKSFYDRIEHPPPEPPKPVIRQITPIKNVGPLRVTPSTPVGTIPRLTQHNLLKSTNDTGGQILVQVPGTSKFVMIPSNIANRFPSSTVLQQIVYQYKPAAGSSPSTVTPSEPASDSSGSVQSTKSVTSQDSQVARLLTEEELQKLLTQAVADGTLSQETLNKLQISYKEPSKARGKSKEAPFETPVSQTVVADAVIVATNERIGKRTQQLRKLLNNRISHMKSVYKKSQTNMHASVLQALVKENPDLFPGLPKRPKSTVTTGTGEPPVKKRRGRRPTKIPLELDESDVTSPVAAPAGEAAPASSVETVPEDPNAIMLRINKKLLASPDEPKVTKAKMISTAPKVDETALVNQPPKKRGRKSNKQKMEEAAAAAAAAQAAADAAALQKAAEEAAAAAAPPAPPSRPASPVKHEISPVKAETMVEEKEGGKKKKKRKREKEKKKKKRKEKETEEVQEPEKVAEKKEKKRKRKKQKVDNDRIESVPEETVRVEIKEEPVREVVQPVTSVEKKGKKRKRDSDASARAAPEAEPPAPKKTKQKKGKAKKKGGEEELHCYCKTPYDDAKFYVGCDRCEKWFHGDCVGVRENDPALANKDWYCPTCRTPPPSIQTPAKEIPSKKKKKKNAKRTKKPKIVPAPEVIVPVAKPAPVEIVVPKPVASKSSKKVPRLKIKLPGSPIPMGIEDLEKSMPAPVPIPALDFDLPPAIPIKNEPLPKLTLKLKKHKVQKKPDVTVKKLALPPMDLEETVEEPAPVNHAAPTPVSVEPVQNGPQKIVREPGKQAKGVRYCFCQELYDPSKGYRKFIKCERCREWYHPRCVGWTSKQADKLRSYKCEACFKNSAFKDSLFRKLSESDCEKLEKMIAQLKGHNQAWPFATPVKEEDAPGYHKVIREPMDFTTVLDKLHNRQYSILQEFLYDCGLIFDNARTFNRENTVYYQCADRMEDEFISKITPFRLGKTSGHAASANAK